MLNEGCEGWSANSDDNLGAIGLSFLAGLKKLQKAHRKAANSYSSWSAMPMNHIPLIHTVLIKL